MFTRRDLSALASHGLTVTVVSTVRPAASYRALELGGVLEVGLVAGSYGVLAMLAAVPTGRYVDRGNRHRSAVIGSLLLLLATSGAILASSLLALTAAVALLGLGQVMIVVSVQAQMAGATMSELDRRFAGFTLAGALGHLLGPILAGTAMTAAWMSAALSPTSRAFVVAGVLALGVVVLALWYRATARTREPLRSSARVPTALSPILRAPGVKGSLLAGIAITTVHDTLIAYLPVIGEQRGLSPAMVGALLATRAAFDLISRLALPLLLRKPRRQLLTTSLALSGLAVTLIAAADQSWQLLALMSLVGLAMGVSLPLVMSRLAQHSPPGARGTALGLRMAVDRLAQVVMPVGFGALASVAGLPVISLLLGAGLLSSSVSMRATGPHAPQTEN